MKVTKKPLVSVIMGSQSDWKWMKSCCDLLDRLQIPYETRVVSAHRTPKLMYRYARRLAGRGIKLIIAGAGGSAHLPGMVAALTQRPVIAVPIQTSTFSGLESLFSMVQMPSGIPVATMPVGKSGPPNAALYAAAMLAPFYPAIDELLIGYRAAQTRNVLDNPDPATAYASAQVLVDTKADAAEAARLHPLLKTVISMMVADGLITVGASS